MPIDRRLDQVNELLASGKTEDAADLLLEITKGGDSVHYNSALMLKNQLEQLQQDVIDGVVSDSEQRLNWAKISRRIIELTRQVEKGEGPKNPKELQLSEQKIKPDKGLPKLLLWGLPIVLLIAFIGFNYFANNHHDKKEVSKIENIPFDGNIIYNDGSPAGNIEVEIIPLSAEVSKLMPSLQFVTQADGTFTSAYPTLMNEEGNTQVNIFFWKNGSPVDKRIDNRFMPINFKDMTIKTQK